MLKQSIRPEFLNRIDELIMFAPLDRKQIKEIVRMQLKQVQNILSTNNIELDVEEDAVEFLADAGFDPQFGARPVKRAIQKYLLNDLSKALLSGSLQANETIKVDVEGDALRFLN